MGHIFMCVCVCVYIYIYIYIAHMRQQCHNSKSVFFFFQKKLLKVLKFYNFLCGQQRHNCSPAATFESCVMTLYLLKVHLQTFLSIPITQKCQILSCDTLVANELYIYIYICIYIYIYIYTHTLCVYVCSCRQCCVTDIFLTPIYNIILEIERKLYIACGVRHPPPLHLKISVDAPQRNGLEKLRDTV